MHLTKERHGIEQQTGRAEPLADAQLVYGAHALNKLAGSGLQSLLCQLV